MKKIISHTAATATPEKRVFIRDGKLIVVQVVGSIAPNARITIGTAKD